MADKIDLGEFEWKLVLRPLTIDDFEDLIELQKKCFPGMTVWSREQIASQLKAFPEGQICIECDGKVIASSSSLILDYDPNMTWHDWKKVSDNGYIRNHNRKGDTLYGLEMMVDPEYRGRKL